ncbi:DUF2726 domain-containing protein [Sphingomonas bacterium]|uniref:DUF2726 domain-containing protein n=1 Tax=Sphingomonas bacterium TaxID=1895847 RepID=UPI0034A03D14
MTQLLTTGHPNSWFGYLAAHLAAHPFAMIVVVMTLAIMLQGAGLRLGPPRPVAKRFLTKREQAMLATLERVLPQCRIHAQVAMGALLTAPDSPFRRRRLSDRNAFSQKIVDFVAQDRTNGAIVALIEVDDWSHVLSRDMARDAMTFRAGYQTVRIPAHARPTFADVRAAVAVLLLSPARADWSAAR